MPIPDFQTLMLPLLRYCADGAEHSKRDAVPALATQFGLNEADLSELLPTGRQGKFDNRVAWAKSYLKQAGLLEITGRGLFKISRRGLEVLNDAPVRIDMKYLERFPEYQEFKGRSRVRADSQALEASASPTTPEELLESGYLQLRDALVIEIQQVVKTNSPAFFERVVVQLLLKMGYGGTREDAGQVVGKSGDGGIDGIINEDRLGLDVIYIQAKRWEADVGRPEIQKFVGALAGNKANKGVFITTSGFTKEARAYAAQVNSKLVLIDGSMLAELMIDYNVGVSTREIYEIKRVDSDFFAED